VIVARATISGLNKKETTRKALERELAEARKQVEDLLR
jgi:hypothetical protein